MVDLKREDKGLLRTYLYGEMCWFYVEFHCGLAIASARHNSDTTLTVTNIDTVVEDLQTRRS